MKFAKSNLVRPSGCRTIGMSNQQDVGPSGYRTIGCRTNGMSDHRDVGPLRRPLTGGIVTNYNVIDHENIISFLYHCFVVMNLPTQFVYPSSSHYDTFYLSKDIISVFILFRLEKKICIYCR